jgi:hypothetical protein
MGHDLVHGEPRGGRGQVRAQRMTTVGPFIRRASVPGDVNGPGF